MKRLTASKKIFREKNLEMGNVVATQEYINQVVSKLAELEDIEEELGIDLITLFKALRQGIYFKSTINNKIYFGTPTLTVYFQLSVSYFTFLNLFDYGKTWALTKEELE